MFSLRASEFLFLLFIYLLGLYLELLPRLTIDPHLLTFNADIWYRLSIAQYVRDHGRFPSFSIRYISYLTMPEWYPPVFPSFLALVAKLSRLDIPTVCSRIIPFLESLAPLSLYFLARHLYGRLAAALATLTLALTTAFVYWNSISDPQSFIMFMMPLVLLVWVWYVQTRAGRSWRNRAAIVAGLGVVLAVSFMTHLMFFLMVIMLFMVHLSLVLKKKASARSTVDLSLAVALSQALTAFWWLPRHLYWWWVNGLSTSSGFKPLGGQMADYGVIAFLIGGACFVVVISKKFFSKDRAQSFLLLPVFWALLPLIETQNEFLLRLIHRADLLWSPLGKPLEGFRFQPFLAQPFALCVGMVVAGVVSAICARRGWMRRPVAIVVAALLGALLLWDIQGISRLSTRLQTAGITINEYKAARWFREHAGPDDRIVADYYRSQMLAGVCGGKALLGLPFPLRNVAAKHVSVKDVQQTRDDVYMIYQTEFAEYAALLMKRYHITHVFISEELAKTGNFGSLYHDTFGARIDRAKFLDGNYFEVVYNKDGILIVKCR
ncbi:MAG: glycosyltransferase family 39 protein [Candidatus Omnitrophota bacterium]